MKLINIESSATVTPASLLAFCDQTSTVLDLYTGSYWNYDTSKSEWYVDIGGAAKLGIPGYDDYVLSKPDGEFSWIPRDGSSGVVEALLPELTKNGATGYITVPSLTIQAYENANFMGNPVRYVTPETNLLVPDGGNAYYVAFRYNMGPTVYLTDDKDSLNLSDRIPLYIVSRIGTTIHSMGFDTQGLGLPQKAEKALILTTPYRRTTDGGLIISEDGSRHILVTAAPILSGTTPVDVLDYNSNLADNLLTHCYHVGGVWTYSTVSAGNGQYNNTQYDNGTNLVNLTNSSKWKVIWVFRSIGDDKEVFYINGNAEYNSSDSAKLEKIPSKPPVIQWHCMLVGRIIIQNGATSGIVQSAFDEVFAGESITIHNNLSGLQGGTASEYYHLTAAERTKVQQLGIVYDAIVNTEAELIAALQSATVQSIFVRSNTPITLQTNVTVGASKRIYGSYFTINACTITHSNFPLYFYNTSIIATGAVVFSNTSGGTVYLGKISGTGTVSSSVVSYYEAVDSTVVLSTNMFQLHWYNTFANAIYDATVCTSADLQAALESNSIQSIYVRLTRANANIVLGSGTADQTITLGTSKNLFGQPFTVGSSTSYVTTLALGANNFRARNDRIDVNGKLTFTGTGTAYIKKLSPSGASNLVVGVSGKLLIENLRTPAAVSNATINMWDMPLRMNSASAVADNQYLKYVASTGEWVPVTITGPTDTPLLKAIDTMPIAAATSGLQIVRNSASVYRAHFTALSPNGDIKLDVNSKVNFFCTQAPGSKPNYMIAIYESTSDVSVALSLVAYSTIAAFPNAIQWNSATLTNITAGITGLSASKKYFIGIIWASNGDANLLGVAAVTPINPTPITLAPAFDVDNLTITGGAPPASITSVTSVQSNRHHYRLTNAT